MGTCCDTKRLAQSKNQITKVDPDEEVQLHELFVTPKLRDNTKRASSINEDRFSTKTKGFGHRYTAQFNIPLSRKDYKENYHLKNKVN